MSEVDFQNGLVVGLTLAGKNGAVGGTTPSPDSGLPTPGAVTLVEASYPALFQVAPPLPYSLWFVSLVVAS